MANVVRLVNGSTIQVRTGVLAGVGPAGPRGLIGPQGPEGPQGPTGETGPQGAISQISARANISSTTTLVSAGEANVAFGTVAYDDLSVFTSSTNFTIPEDGDYQISAYVVFSQGASAGDGVRRLRLVSAVSGEVWRSNDAALASGETVCSLACVYRATAGEVLNLKGYNTDDSSVDIATGAITFTRTGSGPQGAVGPTGPAGAVGATGPAGPQGPDGDASSGFATYADLL